MTQEPQLSTASPQSSNRPATRAIEARSLEKSFGPFAVLRALDLEVADGQAVAIFGANGAGKSTLLRILATLTRPDHGSVSLYGHDLSRRPEAARLQLGAVLHSPMLYGDMTVEENLVFFGRMFRVPNVKERVAEVAGQLGLSPRLEQRVRQLSHGYQKRAALGRALLHRPRVLLLDEAETGLDDRARGVLDGVIEGHRSDGRAVAMTTHSLERGIELSDRVVVLSGGRIALDRPSSGVTAREVTDLYADPGDA